MRKFFCLVLLLVTSCSAPADEFRIENFKSGLVCPDPTSQGKNSKKHSPSVCFENDTILITGQGKCIYNGDDYPCTWYGYEFDYYNAQPNQALDCVVKSNTPQSFGNPEGIEVENTKTYEFRLELDPNETHFFNPTYSIFAYWPAKKNIEKFTTECSLNSKSVFKFSKELIFPESEEKP